MLQTAVIKVSKLAKAVRDTDAAVSVHNPVLFSAEQTEKLFILKKAL